MAGGRGCTGALGEVKGLLRDHQLRCSAASLQSGEAIRGGGQEGGRKKFIRFVIGQASCKGLAKAQPVIHSVGAGVLVINSAGAGALVIHSAGAGALVIHSAGAGALVIHSVGAGVLVIHSAGAGALVIHSVGAGALVIHSAGAAVLDHAVEGVQGFMAVGQAGAAVLAHPGEGYGRAARGVPQSLRPWAV